MKQINKNILILLLILLSANLLKAQTKLQFYAGAKISAQDSSFNQFQNTIYHPYYNPEYMSNKVATSAIMKIDIDWEGKVTSINISDSADSVFIKAFKNH